MSPLVQFSKKFNLIFEKRLHHLNVASFDAVMKNRPSFSFKSSIDRCPIVQQQLHLGVQSKYLYLFLCLVLDKESVDLKVLV